MGRRGYKRAEITPKFIEDRVFYSPDGCWYWTGATMGPKKYGKYHGQLAHRLSYEAFNGPIPDGMLVCHACDNPYCVRPDHLFVGSHADNIADMLHKGRGKPLYGSNNPNTKLTSEIAQKIRELNASGISQGELARTFGVSRPCISDVLTFKRWHDTKAKPTE